MSISDNLGPLQCVDGANQKCVSSSPHLNSSTGAAININYGPRKSVVARWHGIQAVLDIVAGMSVIHKLDFIRYLQAFEVMRLLGLLIFYLCQHHGPLSPDFE